jgi:hypothetical protein
METDLYVLSIDTLFKNPSNIPINPLNIKNAPPATNDSQGYNSGVLNIVNPNNINDDKNEFPKAYYPANAGNYIHFLSEPIKNVTSVRLSSVEFPNVSFIFSQAKGSNYFTLVIPKDKLSVNDPVENPYDSSEEDNIQFNTDNTNAEPYRITIVIPDGIYSYVTLIDQIQSTFDNINNGQYAGGSQNAPGGQGNNNQINNASYPNATLNFNIWYNLITFRIMITNTDLSFNKLLPFGIEFPAPTGPGPSMPYINYDYENKAEGAYSLQGNVDSWSNFYSNADLGTNPKTEKQAPSTFLPLPVAIKKNMHTYPFDATHNRSLGYLLGFRKTIYNIKDCKVQAGTNHQANGNNSSIVQNIIYPNQPTVQPVGGTVGIPPGMGWIAESPLDTQGEAYILMKINEYGNIIHENNPTLYDQVLGYAKDRKTGKLLHDTNGNLIPIKRRVFSRQQDKYFAKILLVSGKGNLIFDNGSNFLTKNYNFRQPIDIKKLHITLHEANGDLINLQGFDYSLTLEFSYILSSVLKNNLEAGLLTLTQSKVQIDNAIIPNPVNDITINELPLPNVEKQIEKQSTDNIVENTLVDHVPSITNKYLLQGKKKKKKANNKFGIMY